MFRGILFLLTLACISSIATQPLSHLSRAGNRITGGPAAGYQCYFAPRYCDPPQTGLHGIMGDKQETVRHTSFKVDTELQVSKGGLTWKIKRQGEEIALEARDPSGQVLGRSVTVAGAPLLLSLPASSVQAYCEPKDVLVEKLKEKLAADQSGATKLACEPRLPDDGTKGQVPETAAAQTESTRPPELETVAQIREQVENVSMHGPKGLFYADSKSADGRKMILTHKWLVKKKLIDPASPEVFEWSPDSVDDTIRKQFGDQWMTAYQKEVLAPLRLYESKRK